MRANRILVIAAAAALCAWWAEPSGADPRVGAAPRHSRIRTTDAGLRRLLDAGTRASITLRTLVDRIEASDVVVFLHSGPVETPGVDGRLLFAGTGGGVRYVVVHLARRGSPHRRIAMLAHELQHAVEIAERPEIVDSRSMAREYERMGARLRADQPGRRTFDTQAAMEITGRVMRELRGSGW